MTVDKWTEQEAGSDCYLCPPRLSLHTTLTSVADLSVSSLYLEKDQRFRGMSCLILNEHSTSLVDLPESTYAAFMHDLRISIAAICTTTHSDHMNVASLGNSCPHLHWTIVPRHRSDPSWGKPIWDSATLLEMKNRPVVLSESETHDLTENIRRRL